MRKMRSFFALVLAIAALLVISGCGTSRTVIIKPVSGTFEKTSAVQVNEISSNNINIPKEALNRIRSVLISKLEKSGAFDIVSGEKGAIILDVKVISFEGGDQFARWFWGGIGSIGEGKLILETTYTDARNGSEIAKIDTEGSITAGFFGGSIDTAYSNAVEEIVKYTVKTFGTR